MHKFHTINIQYPKCVDIYHLENIQKYFNQCLKSEMTVILLNDIANKLVENGHYVAGDVNQKRNDLLVKKSNLEERARLRKGSLEDSHNYQLFDRDADEIKAWIVEKKIENGI